MHTSDEKSMFSVRPLALGSGTAGGHFQHNFRIVFISEGGGTCSIERSGHTVEAGQLLCMVPDHPHHFIPCPGASGYIITFSEAFLTPTPDEPESFHAAGLSLRFALCPVISLQPDVQAELSDLAEKMVKEYAGYNQMRMEILRRYLQIYLIHVVRHMDVAVGMTAPAHVCVLLRKFTALLEQHFREKKMVAAYARQLGVTSNYLNCMVKKYSGYSASYHIRQRVVLEAKRKAIYSGFSMKEIAYELGFDDTAHFSKYFKNVAGDNFSSFKKTLGNEFFFAV